jgi:hypothetical protein
MEPPVYQEYLYKVNLPPTTWWIRIKSAVAVVAEVAGRAVEITAILIKLKRKGKPLAYGVQAYGKLVGIRSARRDQKILEDLIAIYRTQRGSELN